MQKWTLAFLMAVFYAASIFPQSSSSLRNSAILEGNNIITIFSNYGVIGQPYNAGPRLSWKYLSNYYVADNSIVLGIQLPIKDYNGNGTPDTIYSVIITPVDRPGGGEGGGGLAYGFEPVDGFYNPLTPHSYNKVAVSTHPETWPSVWPDHPEYGTGKWNGLFGANSFTGSQETYFQMDDRNDHEMFIRYGFLPDSANPDIKGHGIRISTRYIQFDNPLYHDVLFRIYDIKNESKHNYNKMVFGHLTGTFIGGESPEWSDDYSLYYPKDDIVISGDFDSRVSEFTNPLWRGTPGKFGECFLSPQDKIASCEYFVPAGDITMSNDNQMWWRMYPGYFEYPGSVHYIDSIPYVTFGDDGDYMFASDYFSMPSNTTRRIASAIIFGDNADQIIQKRKIAAALYNSSFDTAAVVNTIKLTSLFSHPVLSGNKNITWNAPSGGTVEIWFSPDAGLTWKKISQSANNTGSYNLNTNNLTDCSFGLLRLFYKTPEGKITAFTTSSYFTINNSINGIPFVKLLDNLDGLEITSNNYPLNFLLDDPEGDSLYLMCSYRLNNDTTLYSGFTIEVNGDTAAQEIFIPFYLLPNGNKVSVQFSVYDFNSIYTDIPTENFVKNNTRTIVGSSNFEYLNFLADVPVQINITNSALLTADELIISFNDSTSTPKKFSVFNKTTGELIIDNKSFYPYSESVEFNGLRLYCEDFETELDLTRSGWNSIHPNQLNPIMKLFTSPTFRGYKTPFDYLISFSDEYADSSNKLYKIFGNLAPPSKIVNFRVFEKQGEEDFERIKFIFTEGSPYRRDTLSFNDQITLSDTDGETISWKIVFYGDSSSIIPAGGDTLYLYTKKGLSVYDTLRVFDLVSKLNENKNSPEQFCLSQNYPNPFNPNTVIEYSVPGYERVTIKIYDILGRELKTLINEYQNRGSYKINFNGAGFASGVYFYQITAGNFVQTKKMTLLK